MKHCSKLLVLLILSVACKLSAQTDSALAEITRMRQTLNGMPSSPATSDVALVTLHKSTYDSLVALLASQKQALDFSKKEIERIRKRLESGTIYFAPGSDKLSREAMQSVQEFVRINGTTENMSLDGFADPTGSIELNENLSKRRAVAVKQYLISELKLSPDKIKVNYFGSGKRICETNDEMCNQRNRRVEISLKK